MNEPIYKIGDKVRITTLDRTGVVSRVFDSHTWGVWSMGAGHEYSIDIDEGGGALTFMEKELEPLELILPTGRKVCECGVEKLGYGKHSDYCPIYDRDA